MDNFETPAQNIRFYRNQKVKGSRCNQKATAEPMGTSYVHIPPSNPRMSSQTDRQQREQLRSHGSTVSLASNRGRILGLGITPEEERGTQSLAWLAGRSVFRSPAKRDELFVT